MPERIEYSERMYVLYAPTQNRKGIGPLVFQKTTTFWFKEFEAANAFCANNPALRSKSAAPFPVTGWDAIIKLSEDLIKEGKDRIVFNVVYDEKGQFTSWSLPAFLQEVRAAKNEPPGRLN